MKNCKHIYFVSSCTKDSIWVKKLLLTKKCTWNLKYCNFEPDYNSQSSVRKRFQVIQHLNKVMECKRNSSAKGEKEKSVHVGSHMCKQWYKGFVRILPATRYNKKITQMVRFDLYIGTIYFFLIISWTTSNGVMVLLKILGQIAITKETNIIINSWKEPVKTNLRVVRYIQVMKKN